VPRLGGSAQPVRLRVDVAAALAYLGGTVPADELHRHLWNLGWQGLGTAGDLARRLVALGFEVALIDGKTYVGGKS
jgi:hypothetical protein